MALTVYKQIKHDKVTWKSGHFYKFKYNAYENDPNPIIIFISAIKGIHPNTGHQWRLIQGINLNYVPRGDRKQFVTLWKTNLEKNTPLNFTWQIVKSKYPYLTKSIRRYMLKPDYYIRDSKYISVLEVDAEVVKSWGSDFSSSVKRTIASKIKGFFSGRRKK
jgi:hypothetical protein